MFEKDYQKLEDTFLPSTKYPWGTRVNIMMVLKVNNDPSRAVTVKP